MGWTVHPEVIQLLEWLALMLGSFVIGILFEKNRVRDNQIKNREERLQKAIERL